MSPRIQITRGSYLIHAAPAVERARRAWRGAFPPGFKINALQITHWYLKDRLLGTGGCVRFVSLVGHTAGLF